jgi:hypothetical protein
MTELQKGVKPRPPPRWAPPGTPLADEGQCAVLRCTAHHAASGKGRQAAPRSAEHLGTPEKHLSELVLAIPREPISELGPKGPRGERSERFALR